MFKKKNPGKVMAKNTRLFVALTAGILVSIHVLGEKNTLLTCRNTSRTDVGALVKMREQQQLLLLILKLPRTV